MACDNQSESGETTSTSLLEDSFNISFEDITYTVRHGLLGRKTILKGLSGSFSAGELTIIMGQSGAGKSTLMDILAGYTEPTDGRIYVNRRLRDPKLFRRRSCYILQDDMVQDTLTIQESLVVAAELKLGNHISREQKYKRVEEIITSLGLTKPRNTRAGDLSGGEKKRLAIGLELVSAPPVMFLDEPTSGLDSSISEQIVVLLNLLARQGRTVVATIHQPSATLLENVDRLYSIVAGRCSYMGSVSMLLPYLDQLQLKCPTYHNRVDFLIDISTDHENLLVGHSQNGKCMDWLANVIIETDRQLEENNKPLLKKVKTEEIHITNLPTLADDPTSKILMKLKSSYSTSFWKQFTTLTKRSLLARWRNPSNWLMITGIHCAMALFVGVLFYNVGGDAKYARENYNSLFYGLMFLMFTAFSAVSITFPEQFPVVRREHFNRWYMTGAYFMATLVSSIPTQTICTLTYACITYWMTGQPLDWIRFISFCWTLILVSFISLCIGLLNGSIFTVKNSVIFGPFFIMPFFVFSGFLLLLRDAPSFFHWMFHISFLKHGFVALTITMFGMDRPKLLCSDLICRYTYPKQVLIDREMMDEKYSLAIVALIGIGITVNICTYIVLKIRLKRKW